MHVKNRLRDRFTFISKSVSEPHKRVHITQLLFSVINENAFLPDSNFVIIFLTKYYLNCCDDKQIILPLRKRENKLKRAHRVQQRLTLQETH